MKSKKNLQQVRQEYADTRAEIDAILNRENSKLEPNEQATKKESRDTHKFKKLGTIILIIFAIIFCVFFLYVFYENDFFVDV